MRRHSGAAQLTMDERLTFSQEAQTFFNMRMPLCTKQAWFARFEVKELECLAQNPEFNPIEHL